MNPGRDPRPGTADRPGPGLALADAAVQLRRLAAWIDGANEEPARLLASALGAVERAVEQR